MASPPWGGLWAGLHEPWDGRSGSTGARSGRSPAPIFATALCTVDQDIALFAGTVRDNITLWDHQTMPETRVIAAARDAMIHDDINPPPRRL